MICDASFAAVTVGVPPVRRYLESFRRDLNTGVNFGLEIALVVCSEGTLTLPAFFIAFAAAFAACSRRYEASRLASLSRLPVALHRVYGIVYYPDAFVAGLGACLIGLHACVPSWHD